MSKHMTWASWALFGIYHTLQKCVLHPTCACVILCILISLLIEHLIAKQYKTLVCCSWVANEITWIPLMCTHVRKYKSLLYHDSGQCGLVLVAVIAYVGRMLADSPRHYVGHLWKTGCGKRGMSSEEQERDTLWLMEKKVWERYSMRG